MIPLFPFFTKKSLLSKADNLRVVEAIQMAEKQTSGEVRVYIETHNPLVSTIDRAKEIFEKEQMHATALRNGVLIYLAIKDKEVAVWGDEGIHQMVGADYWQERVKEMLQLFKNNDIAGGLCSCIHHIGQVLTEKFPYQEGIDKNELRDDILFGQ